ncbi:MAG: hypothetical protein RLZZ507_115 [Cyanobacteriota bacterium]
MLKQICQSSFLALALVPLLLNFNAEIADAAPAIYEDELTTTRGLRWGAPGLPYNEAADIKDSLVDTVLGKVVPDRHGIGASSLGLFGPFQGPQYGRLVFVSLWGSKIEGCFVEMIIQYSPSDGQANANEIVPKLLEVGIGSQAIALPPQANTQKSFSQGYSYEIEREKRKYIVNSTWYMTRNTFALDSNIASILSNAPVKQTRARLTLANGETMIIPIGEGTVKKWKEAYSFNPYCTNLNQPQPQQPSTTPPVSTPSKLPSKPAAKPSQRSSNPQKMAGGKKPPATQSPAPTQRTVGNVALAATQTLDNVLIQLDGANVDSLGNFTANLIIENRSPYLFGFVPVFARVYDANGQRVSARISFNPGEDATIAPGVIQKGKLSIFGQKWQETGSQNLILEIRENSTRGRLFRVPF